MADTETVTPRGSWATVARVYWGVVAAIGTGAFLLSCCISVTQEGNGGALNGLWFTLSYFTVWSNIVAFIANWMLFADPARDGRGFRWFRMTSLVMITGYSIIAVPTGIFTAELTQALRQEGQLLHDCPHCSKPAHERSASFCSRCGSLLFPRRRGDDGS